MALQHVSPVVKFEADATDSFSSAPGSAFAAASLFPPGSPSPSATVNPMDMMTPRSVSDSVRFSVVPEESPPPETETTPGPSDKRPAKKRKSWGQVLPEPKTNLPPRKRAKTDDEKEQRRVERVLRNRRAAQSSRERKRLEVEALEKRNKELEGLLINVRKANLMLVHELNRFRRQSGVIHSPASLDSLRDNQITLSQQLFGSSGPAITAEPATNLVDDFIMSTANPTVNPASLSPELTPVSHITAKSQSSEPTSATSPDLTQRPAEMLCDLQCHVSAEVPKSFRDSQTPMSSLLVWTLRLRMLLLSASGILSACQRPLTQIAMSSKAGFYLRPTPQLLTTIIWLVTLPPASRPLNSSTSTTSSAMRRTTSHQTLWQRAMTSLRTTASSPESTTLRFKSLRKILSSSPNLARPLMDATIVALRLVSEGCDDRVENLRNDSGVMRDQVCQLTQCLSPQVLLTLLWVLSVEERKIQRKSRAVLSDPRLAPQQISQSRNIY